MVTNIGQLTQAVRDLKCSTREFHARPTLTLASGATQEPHPGRDMKLLLWPDPTVQNLEVKTDTLAEQLCNLTLNFNKSQPVSPAEHGAYEGYFVPPDDRTCSFRRKPGTVPPCAKRTQTAIGGAPAVENSATAQLPAGVSRRSPPAERKKEKAILDGLHARV